MGEGWRLDGVTAKLLRERELEDLASMLVGGYGSEWRPRVTPEIAKLDGEVGVNIFRSGWGVSDIIGGFSWDLCASLMEDIEI